MVEVKSSDMPNELRALVEALATDTTQGETDWLVIGQKLRDQVNEQQPGNWQCIVSEHDFASLIRYEPGSYIKLSTNLHYIILFKC